MKFLGQGFHPLEHEHDRQTDRQTRIETTPTDRKMRSNAMSGAVINPLKPSGAKWLHLRASRA